MKYFNGDKFSGEFIGKLKAMLEKLKKDENLRNMYSIYEMDRQMFAEKVAHDRAIETARNFLAENVAVELVAKCTGLSLDEVTALQAETA